MDYDERVNVDKLNPEILGYIFEKVLIKRFRAVYTPEVQQHVCKVITHIL